MTVLYIGRKKYKEILFNESFALEAGKLELLDEAEVGLEGFRKFFWQKPELVIAELKVGRFDGLQLAIHIKKLYPSTLFLLLAELADVHQIQQAVLFGADGFLVLPLKAIEWRETMEALFEKKSRLREAELIEPESVRRRRRDQEFAVDRFLHQLISRVKDETDFLQRIQDASIIFDFYHTSIYEKQLLSKCREELQTNELWNGENLLEKIVNYIDQNFSDATLSLKSIAQRFYMNESYLSRCFKTKVGKNMVDYILEKRICYAITLFQESSLKVHQVAERVGINDAHYFGQCFKKITGITADQFRRESQKKREKKE